MGGAWPCVTVWSVCLIDQLLALAAASRDAPFPILVIRPSLMYRKVPHLASAVKGDGICGRVEESD